MCNGTVYDSVSNLHYWRNLVAVKFWKSFIRRCFAFTYPASTSASQRKHLAVADATLLICTSTEASLGSRFNTSRLQKFHFSEVAIFLLGDLS